MEESAEEEPAAGGVLQGIDSPEGQDWPLGTGALKQESIIRLHFGKTSLSNRFAFLLLFEREDKNNVNKIYFVSLFLCFLYCQTLQ